MGPRTPSNDRVRPAVVSALSPNSTATIQKDQVQAKVAAKKSHGLDSLEVDGVEVLFMFLMLPKRCTYEVDFIQKTNASGIHSSIRTIID
jgi:hypothetical protein